MPSDEPHRRRVSRKVRSVRSAVPCPRMIDADLCGSPLTKGTRLREPYRLVPTLTTPACTGQKHPGDAGAAHHRPGHVHRDDRRDRAPYRRQPGGSSSAHTPVRAALLRRATGRQTSRRFGRGERARQRQGERHIVQTQCHHRLQEICAGTLGRPFTDEYMSAGNSAPGARPETRTHSRSASTRVSSSIFPSRPSLARSPAPTK